MKNSNEEALEALKNFNQAYDWNSNINHVVTKKDAETIRAALQAQAAPVDVELDARRYPNPRKAVSDG